MVSPDVSMGASGGAAAPRADVPLMPERRHSVAVQTSLSLLSWESDRGLTFPSLPH